MTETQTSWRVFVSHASDDKDRFVEPFARRLRSRGIDAWLDKWEMLPGDSLIDKIFEEGLKNASAFVIVLSEASIRSEWVRKELNTATVQSIEKGTKLIPVVIENCEIPVCLKDRLYEKIKDIASYDAEFERIVASIESRVLKPALGTPPNYVTQSLPTVSGLEHQDIAVLKELGVRVMRKNREVYEIVQHDELAEIRTRLGMSHSQLQETLTILEELGMTEASRVISPEIMWVQLSQAGFRKFLDAFCPDFPNQLNKVILSIVSESLTSDSEIAKQTTVPIVLVRYILRDLAARNFFRLSEWNTGCHLYDLSPTLRRAIQNGDFVT